MTQAYIRRNIISETEKAFLVADDVMPAAPKPALLAQIIAE
jgi:hypothetical protein